METATYRNDMRNRIPPSQLPATPDDIDLERIVWDVDYREAVKLLLRNWQVEMPVRDRAGTDGNGE